MRLIDADLLIEWIDAGHLRNPNELCFSESDVVNMIDHMPTIEERKTGKWLRAEWGVRCNLCKGTQITMTPYCSHCGAEMDC